MFQFDIIFPNYEAIDIMEMLLGFMPFLWWMKNYSRDYLSW